MTERTEKFLGQRTDLENETDDLDIEFVEDEPEPPEGSEGEEKPEKPPEEKPEAKADDEDDEELDTYSKRVQKRIDRLTWEREEANRTAQSAKQLRDQAIEYAKALHSRNQQYEQTIGAGEEELIGSIKRAAQASVAAAKKDLFNATEAGNTQEAIDANERLIQAQAELIQAGYRENAAKQRLAQQSAQNWQAGEPYDPSYPPQQQYPQQPQVQQPPQPTQKDLKWRDENEWFHHPDHPDMTSYAYGLHQRLVTKDGVKPNTDQYYQEIDKAMQSKFPEYFGPPKKPSTVVSPSQRDAGPPRRQVKLTASERELVRRLGIDEKEYAANKLKLEQANA